MEIKEARGLLHHMLGIRARREHQLLKLAEYICPWRGMVPALENRNLWERERPERFIAAATDAVTRAASGMTSGMTPRSAAWFKPGFTEPAMTEASGAREWLDRLDRGMESCLAEGGFYQAIQNFNLDLLWAGAGLLYCQKGKRSVLEFTAVAPGSYCVQTDSAGGLTAVARKIRMTASELAESFGEGSLSETARQLALRKPYESVWVWHLALPMKKAQGQFTVESLYFEDKASKNFLRKSGFHEMPYFYAVWNEGPTPYGSGPGDNALADAMQMDLLERDKLAGLAKVVDPPMLCPPELKDALDLSPGAINYYAGGGAVTPAMDLKPYAASLPNLQNEIGIVAGRLESGLMARVFSSMPLEQRPAGMSATEFLERKREALQQLGPIMSAYEPMVLQPLLFRVANTLEREGLLPEPPESLKGLPLFMKMDFISPVANALRQSTVESSRALWQEAAGMAQAVQNPALLDKLDMEQIIDELATGLGAPGSIVRSDADVQKMREAQAKERQAQEQQAMIMSMASNPQAQEAASQLLAGGGNG